MNVIFLYLFLGLVILTILSVVFWSLRNGISPMPTSPKVKRKLIEALSENVTGTIVDLGSGWGTLLFPLARKYPTNQVVGYENSHIPYLWSNIHLWLQPSSHLQILRKDFLDVPLSDTSLAICYLYPGAMEKLKIKFEKELKPGTMIVSHTFAIPGWIPEKTVQVDDLYKTKIYVYMVKSGPSRKSCC